MLARVAKIALAVKCLDSWADHEGPRLDKDELSEVAEGLCGKDERKVVEAASPLRSHKVSHEEWGYYDKLEEVV